MFCASIWPINKSIAARGPANSLLQDISPSAFDQLLSYAYTSHIRISSDNVQSLLFAASILQMDAVCRSCQSFLTNCLTLANCLQVRHFANQHYCQELLAAVDRFCADHFMVGLDLFFLSDFFIQELRTSPELLHVTVEHLQALLASPDLHVRTEADVYETLLDWVAFDAPARQPHLGRLLAQVRLAQLDTDYLLNTVRHNQTIMVGETTRFEAIFFSDFPPDPYSTETK